MTIDQAEFMLKILIKTSFEEKNRRNRVTTAVLFF